MVSNLAKASFIIVILMGTTVLYLQNPDLLDFSDPNLIEEPNTTITQVVETKTQSETTSTSDMINNYAIVLVEIYNTLNRPVGVRNADDGTNRLFVIDQTGIIQVITNDSSSYTSSLFLDIKSEVLYGGEQGLLGLAFHPNFSNNGYFYVNYISNDPVLQTVISRFTVDPLDSNVALIDSELVILTIPQPAQNHNGGDIAFGPDGYLYITLGDGGGSGDQYGNGQNLTTLLGSIVRINIDLNSSYGYYDIPLDNPYNNNTQNYREEIYASGMRNPWRMSFDRFTGELWVGDVGQNSYEEVDIVIAGGNYGWPVMEGFHCFSPSSGCNMIGLELPVHEYGRDIGSTITGGYVYRGSAISQLYGKYIFADYGSGKILYLNGSDPTSYQSVLLFDEPLSFSSFGEDESGELYITSLFGQIFVFDLIEM